MFTLGEIASLFDLPSLDDRTLTGVAIDSRKVKPGELFIAINGERFNGSDFIEDAIQHGAAAVLCSSNMSQSNSLVPELVVPDTVAALAKIATHHRKKLSCAVAALTGSNGKTSVKEMIAKILPQPAHATPGNLNNHIGAPLSVLQLKPEHHYAVFELGANHIGEIAHTVKVVQPQVTLINNIAPAHIGEFGSIEGVAKAKGEIYQGLDENGTAIVNNDDHYAHFWDNLLIGKTILRFSRFNPADVWAKDISFTSDHCGNFTLVTPEGDAHVQLKVPGVHNISNALAASASALGLKISLEAIVNGLNHFSGVSGRMTFKVGKNNSVVIDDTYNANLRSVLTALDVLSAHKGRRVFVFGDMGELGPWTKEHHQEVGRAAREHGIEKFMTCGVHSQFSSQAFGNSAQHYHSQAELLQDLIGELDKNTIVLVKGSRSAAMEKIVQQLIG